MDFSIPHLTASPIFPPKTASPDTTEKGRLGERTAKVGSKDETGIHFQVKQSQINENQDQIQLHRQLQEAMLQFNQDAFSLEFDKYPYAPVSESLREELARALIPFATNTRPVSLRVYRQKLSHYLTGTSLQKLSRMADNQVFRPEALIGQQLFLTIRCLQSLAPALPETKEVLEGEAFTETVAPHLKTTLAHKALQSSVFCLQFQKCTETSAAFFFALLRDSLPIDELALLISELHHLNRKAKDTFPAELSEENRFDDLCTCICLATLTNQPEIFGRILLAGLGTASSGYSRLRAVISDLYTHAQSNDDIFLTRVAARSIRLLNVLPRVLKILLLTQDAPEIQPLDPDTVSTSSDDLARYGQQTQTAHRILSNTRPQYSNEVRKLAHHLIQHIYFFQASKNNERIPASSERVDMIFKHLERYGSLLTQLHKEEHAYSTETYLFSLLSRLIDLSQVPALKRAILLFTPERLASLPPIRQVQMLPYKTDSQTLPVITFGIETALSCSRQTIAGPMGMLISFNTVSSLLAARRKVAHKIQVDKLDYLLDPDMLKDLPSLNLTVSPDLLKGQDAPEKLGHQILFLRKLIDADCTNTESCLHNVSVLFTRHAVAAFLQVWRDYSFKNRLGQTQPSPVETCVTWSKQCFNEQNFESLQLPDSIDIRVEMHPSTAKNGIFDLHYTVKLKPPAFSFTSAPDVLHLSGGTAHYNWKISVCLKDKKSIAILPIVEAMQKNEIPPTLTA